MAHAYTPGLQVKERTHYRTSRLLPIQGDVLVRVGEQVQAEQIVARTQQPGPVTPLNLSNILAVPPAEVPRCLLRKGGEHVAAGDPLAMTNGIFGFFKTVYNSPVAGVIESISNVTGQLILRGEPVPVEVKAFATGEVVDLIPGEGCVVDSKATFVQGIFGIGGEVYGPILVVVDSPQDDLTADRITDECRGKVIVGGRRIHGDAVQRAIDVGAVALIGGGIDDQDLKQILGYDLGVAITGTEEIGVTLIITEGFGEIAMARHTFELFTQRNGAAAAVNGATQIRAGVMRPEIVIPWDDSQQVDETAARVGGGVLEVGTPVRIIRDPY
ncbi:MAG: hypothetical protein KDA58_13435, partial [Planctomycetaceae bacterium]|nr:hypothetical protein [Planctomycetaceae bacterium]